MLENEAMPKVLVLFDSADRGADHLAEIAADGARSVRFTEVDVRVVSDGMASSGTRRRQLESADLVDQYDAVIIVGSNRETPIAIDSLLASLDRSTQGDFVDKVFAAIPAGGPTANRLSATGAIAVGLRAGSPNQDAEARKTGERVAKVAEWVRHAISHEHGHSHSDHARSHRRAH